MSESKEGKPEIKITKSPDFKMLYATGIFGGLNPLEGRMLFFVDRLTPKIVDDAMGQMKTDFVEREFQVEVHMSPGVFIGTYKWMEDHIKRMKEQGILVEGEKPKEES